VTDNLQPARDKLLLGYQIMATVVGINLLLVMTGFIGKLATPDGSWFHRNESGFMIIDQLHGVLFMVLLVLIARLTLRQRWSWAYMLSIALLSCIPVVTFASERRTSHRVHREVAAGQLGAENA
jgi:integral membrane protein